MLKMLITAAAICGLLAFAGCVVTELWPAQGADFGCAQKADRCVCSVQPKGVRGYGPGSDGSIDVVCTDMQTMAVTYFSARRSASGDIEPTQ